MNSPFPLSSIPFILCLSFFHFISVFLSFILYLLCISTSFQVLRAPKGGQNTQHVQNPKAGRNTQHTSAFFSLSFCIWSFSFFLLYSFSLSFVFSLTFFCILSQCLALFLPSFFSICFIFWPANGCCTLYSLVKILIFPFFIVLQVFASFWWKSCIKTYA